MIVSNFYLKIENMTYLSMCRFKDLSSVSSCNYPLGGTQLVDMQTSSKQKQQSNQSDQQQQEIEQSFRLVTDLQSGGINVSSKSTKNISKGLKCSFR